MIRVYLENDDAFGDAEIDFNYIQDAARLIAKDDKNKAWEVLSKKLKCWQPEEAFEVAPVSLLNDDMLFEVMTLERCQAVLNTKFENYLRELEQ